MKEKIFYCAFYSPQSAGFAGQQNLSRPVRAALTDEFEVIDMSPAPMEEVVSLPSLGAVIRAMHRLLLARLCSRGKGGVTVVDMVHSFSALPISHAHDRFIVLGHDSYALRTRRDFAAVRGLGARLRLAVSWLGWCYVEALLRRIAWQSVFVSSIDRAHAAARDASTIVAIPVGAALRAQGARRRAERLPRKPGPPRLLISLPVRNPAQLRIDRDLVMRLLRQCSGTAELTLWGNGAMEVAQELPGAEACVVVEWVDDYVDFLVGFDLLVYPRMVGSGFHGKIAEALVLGLPCLCADWVATPLREAGYGGITSFADPQAFETRVAELLRGLTVAVASDTPPVLPDLPAAAAPEAALAPLVTICADAHTTKEEGRKMTQSDLFRNNVKKSPHSRRIRRRLRLAVSTRPALYSIYARAEKLRFRLTSETTVVVDSYPRSANSFFEAAFKRAHGGREVVAHHSHAAAQVLAGVRRGLPCVVLLREPEAAIASFYEMNGGDYPISLCTLEYAVFYEALMPVADHLVVVETETLEERFYNLLVHLQSRWGLRLEPYEIAPEARAEIMRAVDETGRARNGFAAERYSDSRPEAERAERAALLATIRKTINDPENAKALARARAAHAALQVKSFGYSHEDIA